WFIFIFFSNLILDQNYTFTYLGIFWIFSSCFFLTLGYSFKIVTNKGRFSELDKSLTGPNIPWFLLSVFILLGFLSFIKSATRYGVSLNVLTDFESLQSASNNISEQRYSGTAIGIGILEQMLNSFVYVLPLCGGYSISYADTLKKKILIVFTALPSLLSMLLTSAKLVIVAYVILFFVSYYVSHLYLYKQFIKINYKKTFQAILLGFSLYQLFYLSFILRIGSTSASLGRIIVTKLGIYAFGHVQAFDIWLQTYLSSKPELGLGTNTFLAFSSILGLQDKKQGIYAFISGSSTNVFSQFRALISDFGIVFSLFIVLLLGLVLNILNDNLINSSGRVSVFQQVFYISILFYLLYFIVSPWAYMTFVAAFIIFYFYLLVAFYVKVKIKLR
ncbi:TPA: O-antigen polymerase, partial [Streptococcus suis]